MFKKLESLRGIAACLVVMYHSPFDFGQGPLPFFANCYLFVDMFFILSGFVMSYAYGEKIGKGLGFKKYITLRLGRLYPLHLFMLLVWVPYILACQYLYVKGIGGSDQFKASNLWTFTTNLFLLHAMGLHQALSWNYLSWSISVEFYAYIVFFLTVKLLDRKSLILPLLVFAVLHLFLINAGRDDFNYMVRLGFLRCLSSFYLGVFLFRWYQRRECAGINRHLGACEVASLAFITVAVSLSKHHLVFVTATILGFALTIYVFASTQNGALGGILESSFMRKIGAWSYSIYMVHGIFCSVLYNVCKYLLKIDLDAGLGIISIPLNVALFLTIIFVSKYTYTHIECRFRDMVKQKIKTRSLESR